MRYWCRVVATLLSVFLPFAPAMGEADRAVSDDSPVLQSLFPDRESPETAAPGATALLELILAGAGASTAGLDAAPLRIPLFGFERATDRPVFPEEFTRLRAQRDGVLAALGIQLAGRVPAVASARENGSLSAADAGLIDRCLVILLDLNGVEALPDLLRLESALHEASLYPTQENASAESMEPVSQESADAPVTLAITTHTRVLSVITALLRNTRYAPFLDSPIYEQYRTDFLALIDQQARRPGWFVLNEEPVSFPPENADTIAGLVHLRDTEPAHLDGLFSLDYCPEWRDAIVQVAVRYLREIPVHKRRGETGMARVPVQR